MQETNEILETSTEDKSLTMEIDPNFKIEKELDSLKKDSNDINQKSRIILNILEEQNNRIDVLDYLKRFIHRKVKLNEYLRDIISQDLTNFEYLVIEDISYEMIKVGINNFQKVILFKFFGIDKKLVIEDIDYLKLLEFI